MSVHVRASWCNWSIRKPGLLLASDSEHVWHRQPVRFSEWCFPVLDCCTTTRPAPIVRTRQSLDSDQSGAIKRVSKTASIRDSCRLMRLTTSSNSTWNRRHVPLRLENQYTRWASPKNGDKHHAGAAAQGHAPAWWAAWYDRPVFTSRRREAPTSQRSLSR